MEIYTEKHPQALFELAAGEIATAIAVAFEQKRECVLGIVGGRSADGMLSALVDELSTRKLRDAQLHVFWLDERIHEDKNYVPVLRYLKKLERHLRVSWYPFESTERSQVWMEMSRIEEKLRALGGFDIVFASAGEDGHIASLYPNDPALKVNERVYVLVEHSPKPPPVRVTVSPELITAPHAFLFFVGESKRNAFEWFMEPTVGEEDCPSKILLRSPGLRVYVTK